MSTIETLAIVAHPDDAEGLFGTALQRDAASTHAMVLTNGDQGIDRVRNCLCR